MYIGTSVHQCIGASVHQWNAPVKCARRVCPGRLTGNDNSISVVEKLGLGTRQWKSTSVEKYGVVMEDPYTDGWAATISGCRPSPGCRLRHL